MSIVHVKSNTVGDFTGTVTVYNSAGSTVTANATDLVRPSDWNSSHVVQYIMGGNTVGSSAVSGLDVRLDGGNNITLSADTANSRLIFSGPTQTVQTQSNVQGLSAGTQVGRTGDIVFADSNGLTWGMSGSSQITASYSQSTHSHSTAPGAVAAGTQTGTSGTIVFANSNGITFGMSGSSQVTASHNGLTTARASNDAVGLNTALTAGPLAWTVNSNGISLNAGSAAGTTSGFTGGASISGSMTHNTAGLAISLSHPAWITTARASNDAIGLNTAQSNVTWTVNSSGLSLDARGYAGTGTTFAGTNASASITQNSAGLNLALSVAAGGGATPVASASNGSFSFTTLGFSNANNVTFGTSAGSIITASVAAPGAAAENNWVNLLGANTAGNTTASGSTIGYSGINLTLSGTNGSVVNISAPATSSLVGDRGLSISTAGSTISIQAPVLSYLFMPNEDQITNLSAHANGTMSVQNKLIRAAYTATQLVVPMNISSVATAGNNSTAGINFSISFAIYSENANTLSSMSSTTFSTAGTWTSNATGSVTGAVFMTTPFNALLTPGEYYFGMQISTAATGGGITGAATTSLGNTISIMGLNTAVFGAFSWHTLGSSTNQSIGWAEQGIATGTTAFSNGLAISAISHQGTAAQRANFAAILKAL